MSRTTSFPRFLRGLAALVLVLAGGVVATAPAAQAQEGWIQSASSRVGKSTNEIGLSSPQVGTAYIDSWLDHVIRWPAAVRAGRPFNYERCVTYAIIEETSGYEGALSQVSIDGAWNFVPNGPWYTQAMASGPVSACKAFTAMAPATPGSNVSFTAHSVSLGMYEGAGYAGSCCTTWEWYSPGETGAYTFAIPTVYTNLDAVDDGPYLVQQDGSVTATPLTNDAGLTGGTGTVTSAFSDFKITTQGTKGTCTVSGNQIVYQNTSGRSGADSCVYSVNQAATDAAGPANQPDTATIRFDVNNRPSPQPDTVSTDDTDPVTFDPRRNDTDPNTTDSPTLENNLPLTIIDAKVISGGGTASFTGTDVTYDPLTDYYYLPPGQRATAVVEYTVEDSRGGIQKARVTVIINGAISPPIVVEETTQVGEDAPETFDPTQNDLHLEPGTMHPVITGIDTSATTGSATFTATGITYDPNGRFESLAQGETASDEVTYTIFDGNLSDSGKALITVVGANDAPVAKNDSANAAANAVTTVNVLGNDTDVDTSDTHTVDSVTLTGGQGTVSIVGNKLGYDPAGAYDSLAQGETATVTVDYTMSDNHGATSSATVTLTVGGVNDAPVAFDDDGGSTTEDGPAVTIDVLGNDSDPDGSDTLTVTGVTQPAGGTVTVTGSTVTFDPAGGFDQLVAGETATATFTYTISDPFGGTATATVTVTVTGANDAPIATPDLLSMPATSGAQSIDVLANDLDPDTGSSITLVDLQMGSFGGGFTGTPTISGSTVTFDPAGAFDTLSAGESAEAVGTYTITDEHGVQTIGTVTIRVTGVNVPPSITDTSGSTDEDSDLVFDSLLSLASDPNTGDQLTLLGVGTSGTLGHVSLADEVVTYTPGPALQHLRAGETATDTFTYTVSDGKGGTATGTATVTVIGLNDAPVAVADTLTLTEDAASGSVDVLANDSDPDAGSTLSLTGLTVGAFSGGYTAAPTISGSTVTLVPGTAFQALAAGESSTATITYTVTDENGVSTPGTGTITVTGVNDNPTTGPVTATTGEKTPITWTNLPASGGASDPDKSDQLTVSAVGTTGTIGQVALVNGVVTFTPGAGWAHLAAGQTGTDSFTYTVSDGHGGTATNTVTVTVTGVADQPVLTPDTATTDEDTAVTADVLTNDSHPDAGATLTVIGATLAAGSAGTGTLAFTGGTVTFTPTLNQLSVGQTRTVVVNYTVRDSNGATAASTLTVTVTGVNDAPTAGSTSRTTDEDTAVVFDRLLTLASDPDAADTLTLTAVDGSATVGQVSLVNGVVTYTPGPGWQHLTAGQSGTDSFTYTVSDGHGGTATGTVTVTVTGRTDQPTPAPDTATTNEDTAVTTNVLANDTHPDAGATLTLTGAVLADPSLGQVSVDAAAGTVTFDPDLAYLSQDETKTVVVTYTVKDQNGATATSTLTITVTGLNATPSIDDIQASTDEDTALVFDDLVGVGTDPDTADTLTVTAVDTTGTIGQVALVDGVVTYTPGPGWQHLLEGQTGTDSFTFTISDGHGGTATGTITVTVLGLVDGPTAVPDTASTTEDAPVSTNVVTNDFHREGGTVTFVSATMADSTQGSITTTAAGAITYTPTMNQLSAGETAQVVVNYTIEDAAGRQAGSTLTITVTGTNDAPVAAPGEYSTDEDTALTMSDLLALAQDPDTADTLTITAIDTAGMLGTATLANGVVTYTPAASFQSMPVGTTKTETFTVTYSDGHGGTVTTPVTITITGVNDPAYAEADESFTDEDTPVTLDLTANDTDIDVPAGLFVAAAELEFATDGTLSVSGGQVTYTPSLDELLPGETKRVDIYYTLEDNGGFQMESTWTIEVTGRNDVPSPLNATFTTTEDAALLIGGPFQIAADPDRGEVLTITGLTTTGLVGAATLAGNEITYTPAASLQSLAAGESVTQTFTATVTDSRGASATIPVTIVVTGVNDPVVAAPDTAATDEDTPVTTDVLANDTDVDTSDTHTIVSATPADAADGTVTISGRSITFTPTLDSLGAGETKVVVITYVVRDSGGAEATSTLTVTVTGINDAPSLTDPIEITGDGGNPVTVPQDALNTADPEGGTVTATDVQTQGTYGTTTIVDGLPVYTPNDAYQALPPGVTVTDTVVITVVDENGAIGYLTIEITLVGENDPVAAVDDTASTDEDTPVTTDVLANDVDPDVPAGLTIVSATLAVPADGAVAIDGGSITFTPDLNRLAAGQNHDVVITYVVRDSGGAESTATLTVTVTGLNDAPTGSTPGEVTVNGLEPVTIPQDLLNTADPDGDTVTVTGIDTEPQYGTVTIVDGLPVYTPDPSNRDLGVGETRTDTFVIAVVDEHGVPGFLTITVTIVGVNDAPDAVDDTLVAPVDTATATVKVLANDTDPDTHDVLSVTSATADRGTVSVVNGELVHAFTPAEFLALPIGTPVTVTLTYAISDGHGGTDTATVTITYQRTIGDDVDTDGNGIPDWWEVAFGAGAAGGNALPGVGSTCPVPNRDLVLLNGRLAAAETVTVEGTRQWMPNSRVSYYVCSTPTLLSRVNSTGDGLATATFDLPKTFEPGKHVVFGIGLGLGGETIIQSIGFDVRPPADGGGNGGGGNGGGGNGGGLAHTGTDAALTGLGLGLLLLVVGGLLRVLSVRSARRPRPSRT